MSLTRDKWLWLIATKNKSSPHGKPIWRSEISRWHSMKPVTDYLSDAACHQLVVLDTESGNVVAGIEISGDPDDVFYDSKRHRLYAICGAGKIDIIEQTDANNYKGLTKIDTAEGARTGLFVPERDTLFVAVPHRGSQQAEIRAYQIE